MRHVEILEDIAENSTNEGYRLTAIRDLFDRGHGRPRQAIEVSGPGVAIPFSEISSPAYSPEPYPITDKLDAEPRSGLEGALGAVVDEVYGGGHNASWS